MLKIKTDRIELSKARIMAGYTVSELSDKVGCSRKNLYAIESGKTIPRPSLAKEIIEILNIKFESVFSLVDGD